MNYDFDTPINRRNTNSYKWDIAERHMGTEDVLGMWTADMDFRCPKPMLDKLQERINHGILGYTIRSTNYYEIIQNWIRRRFNWDLKKEWIHFCPPGVIPAVNMLIKILTKPGDPVFAFMPNYDSLYEAAGSMERKLITAPLLYESQGANKTWKLNLPAFEQAIKENNCKIAVFCSPHNPVGRVWTKEELEAFADICATYDVFVISDEVHCDLVRNGVTHTPMGAIPAMTNRCATLMSPNKAFNVAGLMTASVFIQNLELMAAFRKELGNWAMTLDSTFGTLAVETLYSNSECENWLGEVNKYLDGNLEYAVQYINDNVKNVSTHVPEGTYLLWLDFRKTPLRGAALRAYLVQECRLDLCDGWEFDPSCDDYMRLNCACPRSTLVEAMNRLQKGMAKL